MHFESFYLVDWNAVACSQVKHKVSSFVSYIDIGETIYA
jgi:hypothetical protein